MRDERVIIVETGIHNREAKGSEAILLLNLGRVKSEFLKKILHSHPTRIELRCE
jgi:hypothetical protein